MKLVITWVNKFGPNLMKELFLCVSFQLSYNRRRTIQAFTLKTLVKQTCFLNKTFEQPPFGTQSTLKGAFCGIILC